MPHAFGKQGKPAFTHPRIRGGHWYRTSYGLITASGITSALSRPAANTMVLIPFWPAYIGTIDGIAYEVISQATHASGTDVGRLGIYADDGEGRPTGAALFQTGDLNWETIGTGVKTNAVSWTGIRPEPYWLAFGRFTTGTITNVCASFRMADTDDGKDFMMGSITPTVGAIPPPNYTMTIVSSTLPTIGTLVEGPFAESPLLMIKFT